MSASPAGTEDKLWLWLNKSTRRTFKWGLHMTRIENAVGSGTPDVEGTLYKGQFWIELKCSRRPSYEDTPIRVKFRPAQIPWLTRRRKAGGKSYVLIQVGKGAEASRYLIRGDDDLLKVEKGITEEELQKLSLIKPKAKATDILLRASNSL